LIAFQKSSASEQDFIRFQLNELTDADLNQGEQELLEQEQNTLTNIEEIKLALQNASASSRCNEPSVVDYIGEIISQFKNIKAIARS
jgi:DNA repair protein RecN (Recombination protein N)